jgi:hypothetical protein
MQVTTDHPAILIGLERRADDLRWVALDVTGAHLADGGGSEPVATLAAIAERLGPLADRIAGIGVCGAGRTTGMGATYLDPASARRWLPAAAKDAVALGAIPAIDIPLASADDRFDLATARWDEALLERLGTDPRAMPPAVPSGTRVGSLSAEAAAASGVPPGIALAAPTDRIVATALAAALTTPYLTLFQAGDPHEFLVTLPAGQMGEIPSRLRPSLRYHVAPGVAVYVGGFAPHMTPTDLCRLLQRDIGFPADAPIAISAEPAIMGPTGAALLAGIAAGEFVDMAAARRVAHANRPPFTTSWP